MSVMRKAEQDDRGNEDLLGSMVWEVLSTGV